MHRFNISVENNGVCKISRELNYKNGFEKSYNYININLLEIDFLISALEKLKSLMVLK